MWRERDESGRPSPTHPLPLFIIPSVPSRRRAAAVERYGEGDTAGEVLLEAGDGDGGGDGDGDGWVAPPVEGALGAGGLGAAGPAGGGTNDDAAQPPLLNDDEDDERFPPPSSPSPSSSIPDLDDLEIVDPPDAAAAADPAALVAAASTSSAHHPPASTAAATAGAASELGDFVATTTDQADLHLLRTRTYDLLMTYDKYYQTPRIWLVGYGPDRAPLGSADLLDDVAAEHARKTVTWDPFPHGSVRAASIHPCRHAAVMKKLAAVAASGGGGGGGGASAGGSAPPPPSALPVERYLILFLKFIAAVIPTIEYDFTMAAATGGGVGGGVA